MIFLDQDDDNDAIIYERVIRLLKQGREFTRCISLLRTIKSKNTRKYKIIMSSCLANRACSLQFARERKRYEFNIYNEYDIYKKKWIELHSDPVSELYGKEMRGMPILYTIDDGKEFILNDSEYVHTIMLMKSECKALLGSALAQSVTDSERAEIYYYLGWCDFIGLWASSSDKPFDKKQHDTIINNFISATKLDSKNSSYWKSLGDAYVNRCALSGMMLEKKDFSGISGIELYEKAYYAYNECLKNDEADFYVRHRISILGRFLKEGDESNIKVIDVKILHEKNEDFFVMLYMQIEVILLKIRANVKIDLNEIVILTFVWTVFGLRDCSIFSPDRQGVLRYRKG